MYVPRRGAVRRWTPRVLILGFALGAWWHLRTPPLPEDLEGRVEGLVSRAIEEGPTAGIAVGISREGRVVFERGFGLAELEHRVPVTEETVFRVGSLSKQFAAAAVLRLAGQGALALDEPVSTYLPELPPHYAGVTVEMLLTHTGGIPDYPTMERWWEAMALETTPERLVGTFVDEPLDFEPGTAFAYSNSGYALLGLLIERLTDRPYGGHLREALLAPVGLEQTSYCDDRLVVPQRASGYEWYGDGYRHATYVSMSQAYAAGGLCSTVGDLLLWTDLLMGGRVVRRDGIIAMTTPQRLKDGTPVEYGYGLAVGSLDGHRRVSHVGGTLGFSSQMAHYPDDQLTVVVLTNTQDAPAAALEAEIARFVLGLGEETLRDERLAPSDLERYTGRYDLILTEVEVTASDGRLQAVVETPALAGRYTLLSQGRHVFRAERDSEVEVRFQVGAAGVSGVVLSHRGLVLRGVRVPDS